MRRGRVIRIFALVLGICILLTGVVYLLLRQDWWFLLEQKNKRYEPLALSPTSVEEGKVWTLEELLVQSWVEQSDALMLINKDYPLPKGYEAHVQEYNGAYMSPVMVDSYVAMRDAVQSKTGVRIYVSADYRTWEEQEKIFLESDPGVAAPAGCSEHQAGLALDVYAPYHAGMEFIKSSAGREVNRTCAAYGFVIRYPLHKTDVTGFAYEPWHLRYVGMPHATLMSQSGLVLEEYIQALTPDVWFSFEGYLILRTASETVTLPEQTSHCTVSPDNTGYYIITVTTDADVS